MAKHKPSIGQMKLFDSKETGTRIWLSNNRMTVAVTYNENGCIYEAAPIVRKFIGQSIDNLKNWMSRYSAFKFVILTKR